MRCVFEPIFTVLAEHINTQYDYDGNYMPIDYSYRFHMSVLRLNHQIQLEARQTFERECLFVSVITSENSIYSRLKAYGLLVVAQNHRLHSFPSTAMTLAITAANEVDTWLAEGESLENRLLSNYIIVCEDVPSFCTSVVRIRNWHGEATKGEILHIRVNLSIQGDGSLHPGSRLRRLLDPLRQLHSIGHVDIRGLESQSFQADIINNISAPPDTVMTTMAKTVSIFEQGDKARGFGDLPLAVVKYNTGVNIIPLANSHYRKGNGTIDHGPDAGQPMKWFAPQPPCLHGN